MFWSQNQGKTVNFYLRIITYKSKSYRSFQLAFIVVFEVYILLSVHHKILEHCVPRCYVTGNVWYIVKYFQIDYFFKQQACRSTVQFYNLWMVTIYWNGENHICRKKTDNRFQTHPYCSRNQTKNNFFAHSLLRSFLYG